MTLAMMIGIGLMIVSWVLSQVLVPAEDGPRWWDAATALLFLAGYAVAVWSGGAMLWGALQ